VPDLIGKILALDEAMDAAAIPHAFGGALALAWCTEQARGTIDIDLNVFVDGDGAARVFAAFPEGVQWSDADVAITMRDGQIRLWWDSTPVDLFLNTSEFHRQAAGRARREPFAGREVPFLSCTDLAVFKAFFNRTKDWADLEAMLEVGALDVDRVLGVLVRYLGADDERVERLRGLTTAG
jgi:hypothetical protein